MPDGAKNTMENNPTETTVEPVAVESPQAETTPGETAEVSTDSSSQEDLTALIEAEKARKPDPEKALQRFKRDHSEETNEVVDDGDRPLTRRELEELLARHEQRLVVETQEDKLVKFSEEIAGTPQEAELVRAIHANRIFPTGMSLREQLEESYAIANVKRIAARNEELKRKIASQQTASRNTATTHRDPQAALEPDMAPDLKASMVRAGYAFNSTTRRYEKKLPNGKVLVKENGRPPYIVG